MCIVEHLKIERIYVFFWCNYIQNKNDSYLSHRSKKKSLLKLIDNVNNITLFITKIKKYISIFSFYLIFNIKFVKFFIAITIWIVKKIMSWNNDFKLKWIHHDSSRRNTHYIQIFLDRVVISILYKTRRKTQLSHFRRFRFLSFFFEFFLQNRQ